MQMKNSANNKILCLVQMPPPLNGANKINLEAHDILNEHFDVILINICLASSIQNSGRFQVFKLFRFAKIMILILYHLIFNKIKLVYVTPAIRGIPFYVSSIFIFVSKIFCPRVVLHLHSHFSRVVEKNERLKHFFYFIIFRNTSVILLSESFRPDLNGFGISNFYLVRNFVESVSDKTQDNIIRKGMKIGFIANLKKQKGIFKFVEVVEFLINKKFDAQFIIAGDWSSEEDKNQMRALLEKNPLLSRNITWLGHVSDDMKNKFYNSIDLLIYPSFFDAMPLVLLESASFGKPFISGVDGAMKEISLEFSCFSCCPESPYFCEEVCAQIMKYSNLEYYNHSSRIMVEVCENVFSREKFETSLVDVIRDNLNNHN